MAEEVFGIESSDVLRLRRMLAAYESGSLGGTQQSGNDPRFLPVGTRRVFGILTSSITGTSTLTGPPNTGTLNIYTLTSTGGTTDTGRDETIYHFAVTDATTDRWTFASREDEGGILLLDYQACS